MSDLKNLQKQAIDFLQNIAEAANNGQILALGDAENFIAGYFDSEEKIKQIIWQLNNFEYSGNILDDTIKFMEITDNLAYRGKLLNGEVDPTQLLIEMKLYNSSITDPKNEIYINPSKHPNQISQLKFNDLPIAKVTVIENILSGKKSN